MAKLMACCGIDCAVCPAYIATQKNDKKGLAKTAAKWSKLYKVDTKPEDVICDGCATPSPRKTIFIKECKIRICCLDKNVENCACCEEYICKKLEEFFKEAPTAKKGLEKIRASKKKKKS